MSFCSICKKSICNTSLKTSSERYMKIQKVLDAIFVKKFWIEEITTIVTLRCAKRNLNAAVSRWSVYFIALHVYIKHRDKLFKCENWSVQYFNERKCQRHQQTYKVTYYIVSISIFWFMSFKIYLACLQAPVPVAVNQMACSPPHLPPSQKIVFLILTYRIRVNSLK